MDKIFLLDDGNYASRLEVAINELEEHELKKFNSLKELYNSIIQLKPQTILLDSKSANKHLAKKIIKFYPFIPVIIYGDFGKTPKKVNKTIKKFINSGFTDCFSAQLILNKESIILRMKEILWKGLAKEEIWQKEKNIAGSELKINFFRNIFASGITFCIILFASFVFKDRIFVDRIVSPRVYEIQYKNLSGLVLNRNILWTCNWQTQTIYKHLIRDNLRIEQVFTFPELRFSGITFAGGYLWTIDPWQKKIYKHTLDNKLSIIKEYPSPGPNPTGITSDGKYIFICDNALNKIFVHKLDERLTIIKETVIPLENPTGIFSDGKYLWLVDTQTNRLFRYVLSDFELVVDSIFVPQNFENFKISSIGGDNKYLWLASEKNGKIYKYPKEFLEPVE